MKRRNVPTAVTALLRGEGVSQKHIGTSNEENEKAALRIDNVHTQFVVENLNSMHPILSVNSTISYQVGGYVLGNPGNPFNAFLFLHEVNDLWYINPLDVDSSAVKLVALVRYENEGVAESVKSMPTRGVLHSVLEQYSGEKVACYHPEANKSLVDNVYGLEISLLREHCTADSDVLGHVAVNSDNITSSAGGKIVLEISYKLPLHTRYASLCTNAGNGAEDLSARLDLVGLDITASERKLLNKVGYIGSVATAPELYSFSYENPTMHTPSNPAGESILRVADVNSGAGGCSLSQNCPSEDFQPEIVLRPHGYSEGSVTKALLFVPISQPYISFDFVYRMNFAFVILSCCFLIYMIIKKK